MALLFSFLISAIATAQNAADTDDVAPPNAGRDATVEALLVSVQVAGEADDAGEGEVGGQTEGGAAADALLAGAQEEAAGGDEEGEEPEAADVVSHILGTDDEDADAQTPAAPNRPPGDLGLKEWLNEKRLFFRIPEYDQEPDETAAELQRMYATLSTSVKQLAADNHDVQTLVNKIAKQHKDARTEILKKKPGRQLDWDPLFKDLRAEIQTLVNEDKFFAGDLRYWQEAFEELAEGFGELEQVLARYRDLTEEERRNMRNADTGTSLTSDVQTSGGVFFSGPPHHARKMYRIYRYHARRMYHIRGY